MGTNLNKCNLFILIVAWCTDSVVINIRAYVPGVRGTPQLARWRVAAAVFHSCYCSVQIIHTSRIVSAVLLCNSGVTRV